jgi:acetyl-CoA carboxylase carboxyl transferase subunit alpha
MNATPTGLEFEAPILAIEAELRSLLQSNQSDEATEERVRQLRRQWADTTRTVYGQLNPWQVVQVSRHKDRPYTRDYLNLAFDEFVELHGDKFFGDDRAMLTGFAKLDRHKVMVVGHQKGRNMVCRSFVLSTRRAPFLESVPRSVVSRK